MTDPQSNILNQMDITTDGYGFMLTFGNLVWVPFLFGVQARYLAFHPIDLGLPASAAIFAFTLVGLWIFRGANGEKDAFRNGRNPKSRSSHLCSIEMKQARRMAELGGDAVISRVHRGSMTGWNMNPNQKTS